MSEFKGTRGPWLDKDIPVRAIDTERIGFSLVFMSTGLDEVKATCLANARLIAAAPDLLEALQAVVHLAQSCIENITDDEQEVIDKARDAIAKALGKENK